MAKDKSNKYQRKSLINEASITNSEILYKKFHKIILLLASKKPYNSGLDFWSK